MIELPQVTLVLVDGSPKATHPSRDINVAVKVIRHCIKDVNFGAVKLFHAQDLPENSPEEIEYTKIEKMPLIGYSQFIFHKLVDFIDTDYMLIIQNDGFIINPHLWTDDFLNYDYIGAPWPWNVYKSPVGNGGFSLRSKALMKECQGLTFEGINYLLPPVNTAEDILICEYYYNDLTEKGYKFAPIDLASRFSLEYDMPDHKFDMKGHFGFHGIFQTSAFPMAKERKVLLDSLI